MSQKPLVRRFAAGEWADYRDLRLRSLADSPDAFGSTLALETGRADAEWEGRIAEGVASKQDCPLVALLGEAFVGLAWGRIEDAKPGDAQLYQMWVAPEARRLGVGRLLLEEVVRWARACGVTRLVLEVNVANEPARRLYERAGFQKQGQPEALRDGLMGQRMERRLGALVAFGKNLYIAQDEVRFYGFAIQTRMAVVLLSGSRLLLYSPVWLSEALGAELDALGKVSYVLSPNKIHNQTLQDYAAAYPDAEIHVPPGLPERCPELQAPLLLGDDAPEGWRGEVDQVLTGGNVFFSEAVLFHRASRTLLVGDLVEKLEAATASRWGRLAARLFGVGSESVASPEFRYYTHDAADAERALERIQHWDFEQIFLCHGALVTEHAREEFRRVAQNLLRVVRKRSAPFRLIMRQLAKWQ